MIGVTAICFEPRRLEFYNVLWKACKFLAGNVSSVTFSPILSPHINIFYKTKLFELSTLKEPEPFFLNVSWVDLLSDPSPENQGHLLSSVPPPPWNDP